MHPISKVNFGPKGIQGQYYNGTSVVNGYILRQIGTSRFIVTDGSHPKIVDLARTSAEVSGLGSSKPTIFTILVTPSGSGSAQHIRSIYSRVCETVEGHHYSWTIGTSKFGSAVIPNFS